MKKGLEEILEGIGESFFAISVLFAVIFIVWIVAILCASAKLNDTSISDTKGRNYEIFRAIQHFSSTSRARRINAA